MDLEGYVYDPGEGVANLILKVVNYLSTYGANCPVTGPYSSTSNYKSMTNVEWNSLLGGPGSCGTNSLPEAVTALNVYRNCRSISHLCPPHMNKRGYYHSVVNNPNAFDGGVGGGISGNPYPGELWCTNTHFSYAAAGNWWCNQSNTTLSGTQLNTYLFNQISHANSSVSYPVEVTDRIIHSQVLYVSTFDGTCNCMVGYPYQYWYMELTTGVFTCHEPYE